MDSQFRDVRRIGVVAGVVLLLVTAGTVPAVGVTTGPASATQLGGSTADTVSVSENVSVWERAALPFRANATTAPTQVRNSQAFLTIESENLDIPLNKETLAVHETGEKIYLELDSATTGANTDAFAGEPAQVVIARLDENASRIGGDTTVDPFERTGQLLTPETANENASFRVLDNKEINGNGNMQISFEPQKAGQYAVFLVTKDSRNGFAADDGDLALDGNVTVVGMDEVFVQQTASAVAIPNGKNSLELGDSVYFETESNLQGKSNVSHVMVLYERSTFVNSQATVSVAGDLDNVTEEDVTLEHSIEAVNGIARVRDEDFDGSASMGGTILGVDFGDGKTAKQVGLGGALDFIVTNANASLPETTATDDGVLNASATVVVTASPEQKTGLRVGTLQNWSAGEYRWVYAAVGEESNELSTKTGTVTLAKPDGGGSPGDSPGDDPNDDPGTGPGPSPSPNQDPSPVPPSPSVDVTVENVTATEILASVENAQANEQVSIDASAASAVSVVGTLEQISLTPAVDGAFEVGVASVETVPAGTPALGESGATDALQYFNVTHTISDENVNGATFAFSVERSQLESAPEAVTLYRYHDGSWNALETEFVDEANGTYRFEAASPGLSVFALAVGRPSLGVENAALGEQSIEAGQSATVTATIANDGRASGTFTAELAVDGSVVAEQQVTVPAGETRQVSFTRTYDEAGEYDVSVSGSAAGTLAVERESTVTETSTTPGGEGGDGLGLGAIALLVLVLVALAAGVVYFVHQREEF